MEFVQIMEITTSKYEAVVDLDRQWRAATEGKRTLRREIVARDRNNPNRFTILAFFDSYESAMENSNLPETQEFATCFGEFTDGPPTFQDLDIIEDNA
jgi:quinol monooxygenase YgiN